MRAAEGCAGWESRDSSQAPGGGPPGRGPPACATASASAAVCQSTGAATKGGLSVPAHSPCRSHSSPFGCFSAGALAVTLPQISGAPPASQCSITKAYRHSAKLHAQRGMPEGVSALDHGGAGTPRFVLHLDLPPLRTLSGALDVLLQTKAPTEAVAIPAAASQEAKALFAPASRAAGEGPRSAGDLHNAGGAPGGPPAGGVAGTPSGGNLAGGPLEEALWTLVVALPECAAFRVGSLLRHLCGDLLNDLTALYLLPSPIEQQHQQEQQQQRLKEGVGGRPLYAVLCRWSSQAVGRRFVQRASGVGPHSLVPGAAATNTAGSVEAMWQLPGCPVCLSRADASASGLYTLPFSWLGSAAAVRAASRDAAAFTPTPPEMPEEGTSAAAALRAAAAAALSHCAACAGVLHWMLLKRQQQQRAPSRPTPVGVWCRIFFPSRSRCSASGQNCSNGSPIDSSLSPPLLLPASQPCRASAICRCSAPVPPSRRLRSLQRRPCEEALDLATPLGPPWIRVVGSGGGAGGPQHGGAPSTTSLTSPHGATLPGGTRRHPQETSSFELRMGLERLRCVATETTPARHGGGPLAAAAAAAECFADSKASAATENGEAAGEGGPSGGNEACGGASSRARDAAAGLADGAEEEEEGLEGCGESLADGCLAGAHAQLPTDAQDGVQEQQLSLILSSQLEYQREIYEVRLHVLASSLLGELELKNAQMSSLEDRALHIQVELADLACRRQDLFASISSLEKENKALSEELLFLTQLTAAMQSDAMKQPNPSPTSTPANATEGISRTDGEVAFAEDAFSGRRHARQHADNSSSSHGYADEQTPPAAATAEDEADGSGGGLSPAAAASKCKRRKSAAAGAAASSSSAETGKSGSKNSKRITQLEATVKRLEEEVASLIEEVARLGEAEPAASGRS
ncbi:uncharacterized protein LOC34624437 [Cyclospora cayetanensis]|uniref:Uncharacterized protein LOC34624437 n=1 Tax=Cyclospora cayetanensis TaxID=88456 RepID=A0A6P6S302_9EIME|nr:uncharacterized protein LOC34624437 [Cyclospora cayetanensis]